MVRIGGVRVSTWCAVWVFLSCAVGIAAQGAATLSGSVQDEQQGVIVGATVTLHGPGADRTVQTDLRTNFFDREGVVATMQTHLGNGEPRPDRLQHGDCWRHVV
jgi:hypothetical protein